MSEEELRADRRDVQVSVVIPTTGRDELHRAVRSAREQHGAGLVEIVVVSDAATGPHTPDVDADVVVWTGGGRRGGFARNLGVRTARGRFVAFLDDDDESNYQNVIYV